MTDALKRAEQVANAYHNYLRVKESLSSFGPHSYGAERIADERRRQMREEGHTIEHDQQHTGCELLSAAAAYVLAAADPDDARYSTGVLYWPWNPSSFKPAGSPTRNLEKAGALIAAEIDRRRVADAEAKLRAVVEGGGRRN